MFPTHSKYLLPAVWPVWAIVLFILGHALPAPGAEALPYQALRAPLMTRWAAEVNPTNSLREYPRPQLVRRDWLNLNGVWDYAIRPIAAAQPGSFDGTVLVPFPIQSALSGVMKELDDASSLWYRRTVVVPADWKGKRIRLQFGAVDWECRVLVNGREAGRHRGGYDRFAFDITGLLRWEGNEEIMVVVSDPTEGDQPRGKQARTPEGIFYTANSGIWQTIWMEPVPSVSIDELKLTPDVEAKGLRVRAGVNSLEENVEVELVASAAGVEVGRTRGLANTELFLRLVPPAPGSPAPSAPLSAATNNGVALRLWSPGDPFLYDLQVTLRAGDRVLDQVSSYFGMRKVSVLPDEQGVPRIAINNQFIFQIGVLDQGFWPDGIYTAPTDEALKSDIGYLKKAGFNLARKHVKVEPDRWYYWCDKLGLLVWQDMPSGKNTTPEARQVFESELANMLSNLHNHPSIILWVLFNEGWGQYDTERLSHWIKAADPSRLVNNASGWTDMRVGDVVDVHSYPGPDGPEPETRRAAVLGEFGGLGLPVEGHSWSSNRWGYKAVQDAPTLASSYARLLERVWSLHDLRGLSAAVYTQISDVETECNGLLTYDRAVAKLDPAAAAEANHTLRRTRLSRSVVGSALQMHSLWRYTLQNPGMDWFSPKYDESRWSTGGAGFGTSLTPGARVGTIWDTSDIWLRREFTLRDEDLGGLRLEVHHDEDAEIYLNGVLAAKLEGFTSMYEEFDIAAEAAATLKAGTNTIAVHCHQTAGGQYIDVGLVGPKISRQTTSQFQPQAPATQ